jgi:8-oxo-dGTP pyrophosphatase MutT (NUDIX family)
VTRIEHFEEENGPRANSVVPAASAVVVDEAGRLLLVKRTDNGLWTIPGGAMDPGEDIAACCLREVKEESGLDVVIDALIGIYSNPRHVVEYQNGELRQQFSVCFACHPLSNDVATSSETSEVGFFSVEETETMDIHPSIRLRIQHYLEHRSSPVIA